MIVKADQLENLIASCAAQLLALTQKLFHRTDMFSYRRLNVITYNKLPVRHHLHTQRKTINVHNSVTINESNNHTTD